jgi:hypothetical protein
MRWWRIQRLTPSICAGGEYVLVGDIALEQVLANRDRLPIIQGLPERAYEAKAPAGAADLYNVPEGSGDAVFYREVARICKGIYLAGGNKDLAMAAAHARNRDFRVPMQVSAVESKVNHWWGKTINGRNEFGGGHRPRVRGWRQELAGRDRHSMPSWAGWRKRTAPTPSSGSRTA